MPNYQLFATTPKAMEDILADELRTLAAINVKSTIAGAYFEGDLSTAYRVCLWSRIANRVLLQLSTFKVTSQDDLYQGISKTNWFEHLKPEGSFAVTFNAKNSQAINNTHFGALKVKDAVVDQMRAKFQMRPNIDTEQPDIRINVNLNGENAVLSLDLSGESLHRRGYRDTTIKAPIKENLAAALLIRSRWPSIAKQSGTLIDPMCGSGTLLVEGAMIAADYAPGLLRSYYGFKGWKKHDAGSWQTLLDEAKQRKTAGLAKLPTIIGFDKDSRNINAALAHITNAGLQNKIHLECRDIADAAPATSWKPGLVICNPPYGERLGDEQETAELYKKFGDSLKAHFNHWQAAMIISNPELGFRLGIRSQKPATFYNGALECKLLRMTIVDTAFFVPKPKTTEERIALVIEAATTQQNDSSTKTSTHRKADKDNELGGESLDYREVNKEREQGAVSFANRLQKNLKKLSSWKKRNNISCYRIYDADLPEFAVAIDLYQGKETWVNVQEYDPPKSIDPFKATQRLAALLAEIPKVLGVAPDHVFLKIRRKQKNTDQYQKLGELGHFHVIEEHGCKLQVNFTDYLDTGLFLDHRPMRLLIQQQAKGKRFLNLFAYTGSVTIHAAVGGALTTTTVDMSKTYVDWAKTNLALNQTTDEHEFIQADCLDWLTSESSHSYPRQYELIFLDPPTFSNSKRMEDVFDIQQDHVTLIQQAATLLAPDGVLYFSTNFRRFKIDQAALTPLTIEDITAQTIPEDFIRNPKIHYCWRITK
ncbi:bifunctional 23S rRNA (guanine(2069)-N(7))-methyltransferase RlmK/23S rRNA (guanine(2445)-N(2))-methyltransferase RlmL [Methyloglobulus sp.]|uniref:bifunctional 23S rRNA (guanine(2069)-N(7))-methyltransferase RlmK/23S rRNA (guanine(2445)-N(2))-methyltransferase RlmL n=1 Tax=Methyloglobulus sp. TaxID=2518622 RepID=UPI0032B79C97